MQAVKLPGELSRSNFENLLKVNPDIKDYLERQNRLEEKKLTEAKKARVIMYEEIQRQMKRSNRSFIKDHERSVRASWQKDY